MSGREVNTKGNANKGAEAEAAKEQAKKRKEEPKKNGPDKDSASTEQKKQTGSPKKASATEDSPRNQKQGRSKNQKKKKKRPVPMASNQSPRSSNKGRRSKGGNLTTGPHKLNSAWTIHVNKKPSKRQAEKQSTDEYLKSLKELGTFDTIEDFWRHYSQLKDATDIPQNYVLSVFRKDFDPAWETFPNGGCWIIRVSKDHNDPDVLNRLWEELLFAVIGEAFKTSDLAGVMLLKKGTPKDQKQKRNRDAVTIWNAGNSQDATTYMKIGERLRSVCNLDTIEPRDGSKLTIEYKRFRESLLRDKSTTMNARKYVYQPLYT